MALLNHRDVTIPQQWSEPVDSLTQRPLKSLRHRNACVARITDAQEHHGIEDREPRLQFRAAEMRFDHHMPAGEFRLVGQLVHPVREQRDDPMFAQSGDHKFARDIEHPGGRAGMQTYGRDHQRRPR